MDEPLTLEEAAACAFLAHFLLERMADEEMDKHIPSTPLRRGFLKTGQLEHILVSLMALAHCVYPQLADEEVFEAALRESGVSRSIN